MNWLVVAIICWAVYCVVDRFLTHREQMHDLPGDPLVAESSTAVRFDKHA